LISSKCTFLHPDPMRSHATQGSHMKRSFSVNLVNHNQMAVHALSGCTKSSSSQQTGTNGSPNCTDGTGCTVEETNLNSAGAAFANAQGGVWATQFDVSGASQLVLFTGGPC
jgi:hypothetical protein